MKSGVLNIAIKAARLAGNALLDHYTRLADLGLESKEGQEVVSDADLMAERIILQEISKAYPQHAVLSEEAGSSGEGDHQWIIDPLDGTHNFVRGSGHFCISIAHRFQGKLENALVYDPLREDLFTATRGKGAYLNDRRIRASQRKHLEGSMVASGLPFFAREKAGIWGQALAELQMHVQDIRITGSAALDMAYVAAGHFDVYFQSELKPWDMAAGTLLIREAGGMIMDIDGSEKWLESGRVLCGAPKLMPGMIKSLKTLV